MIEEGNRMASVPKTLPVIESLREVFCCPNRKRVFSPQNWQKNIYLLVSIQSNTKYPNNMANWFVVFGAWQLQHSAGLLIILDVRLFWHKNFTLTLTVQYWRLKLNRYLLEWRGCLYWLDFASNSAKILGRCSACKVKQAPTQPSEMAWHSQGPSSRPLFFKWKRINLLYNFKRCQFQNRLWIAQTTALDFSNVRYFQLYAMYRGIATRIFKWTSRNKQTQKFQSQ